jgi:hypothetical protein
MCVYYDLYAIAIEDCGQLHTSPSNQGNQVIFIQETSHHLHKQHVQTLARKKVVF